MKNIKFKKIHLLSYIEKKARIIDLDSDIVIVKGGQNKGKSCLLKSLYWALGCEPKSFPDQWKKANIVALLNFTIDGIKYESLHIGQDVYVYCNAIQLFKSKNYLPSKELSILLGIDINTAKNSTEKTLSKGAIFMPFYIDQDNGWEEPWYSFNKIGTSSERHNAFYYHTGIIDENYFIIKNKLNNVNCKLRTLNSKITSQHEIVNDITKGLKNLNISITKEEFKEEIDRFLTQLERLKETQLTTLKNLQIYYSKESYYRVKITQLHKDIDEMQKDLKYALEQEDVVVCPTCGAKYENNMINRYDIARDEFETKDLIIRYQTELDKIQCAIELEKKNIEKANEDIIKTQEIINTKKNEVTLKDFLESQANKHLMTALTNRSIKYATKKNELETESNQLFEKLKDMGEKSDKKEILSSFKSYIISAFKEMGIKLSPEANINIGGKFDFSGSSLPRAIIAYYFSYFKIMSKHHGPILAPIVIDEPKQNGIVDSGYDKLLKYMEKERPKESQIILAIASEPNINFCNSNVKYIDLGKYNTLLIKDDFETAKAKVEKLMSDNFSLSFER